jgi:hypothetical protein
MHVDARENSPRIGRRCAALEKQVAPMSKIKMMLFVKRKPSLTPEEFRVGYETRISRRALNSFGHLWESYRRHYVTSAQTFGGAAGLAPENGSAPVFPYDAVSEIVFKDKAALEEQGRLSRSAENRAAINADEEAFFDRGACWSVFVEALEEDLSRLDGKK